ncbi:MAG: hypothetical protein NWQ48_13970 [Alishewanella sp.]|nr:hypothetical protein [Alishewanella sp.]
MMRFLLLLAIIALPVHALCPPLTPEATQVKLQHDLNGQLWLQSSESAQQLLLTEDKLGKVVAQLELTTTGIHSSIQAQPLVEDRNLDGVVDHIWLLSREGLLWRLPYADGQFGVAREMADLTASGLRFIATAGLLRTKLPTTLAPPSWGIADQYLVLVIGRHPQTGHDSIMLLRFGLNRLQQSVIHYQHLADRTLLDPAEQAQTLSAQDWRALLSNAGWKIHLPGKISSKPLVAAGVLYAPVAKTDTAAECETEQTDQLLYALQVHTGGRVYAERMMTVPFLADAQLRLRQNADKSIKLELGSDFQNRLLLTNLRKISAECYHCSEPLSLDKFPIWQRLATYRSEQGAH